VNLSLGEGGNPFEHKMKALEIKGIFTVWRAAESRQKEDFE